MKKVLLVTVGGSPQPIITSVQTLKPDRVIFLCSGGSRGSQSQVFGDGKPCKIFKNGKIEKEFHNLPTYLSLGELFDPQQDVILIDDPDDPSECYGSVTGAIRDLLENYNKQELMADYTGGTKTMSLSLAMAAMDYEIALYLTTRPRPDLKGIESDERTEMVSTSLIDVDRKIEQFLPVFLCQYSYPAAIAQLENLLISTPLLAESKRRVRQLLDYCKAFDFWDRFDHSGAWNLLQNLMANSEIRSFGLSLKRVMQSREDIDEDYTAAAKIKGNSYEIVEDLLLNAKRRVIQERYDDAVARLYRALELLAQVRLRKAYQIKTGNVETEKLPESLRESYEKRFPGGKEIKLALKESYELLEAFSDDPLGKLYQQHTNNIMDKLKIRNQSILAHGFTPITAEKYQEFSDVVVPFIEKGILLCSSEKKPELPQFPCSSNLDNWAVFELQKQNLNNSGGVRTCSVT